jgi:hypothetical protein
MALDTSDIALIKGMLARGDRQSDIAAFFGVNGGRVAEINTGLRGAEVIAANTETLPPPGPYVMSARTALKARQTLEALLDLIDESLAEISAWEKRSSSEG